MRQLSPTISREDDIRHDSRGTDYAGALFDAVISGQFEQGQDLCRAALANPDVGLQRIHALLMLPVIRRVGTAWAEDTASFEQTSMAFTLLHRLLDRLAQGPAPGPGLATSLKLNVARQRLMVAVAPGDTHSFGAMILTQELRLRGWGVTFFDHSQCDHVIAALAEQSFDTLAISVSCDESLAGLSDLVATCRMASRDPKLEILVGGAAIQAPFGQYGFLQADKVGLSIEEVVVALASREVERQRMKWN